MLTSILERSNNSLVADPSDRVLRARKQDAAVKTLLRAEQKAAKKTRAAQSQLYEAARIRREALLEAKRVGVPVAELAEILDVSVQRVYQLLSDAPTDDEDEDLEPAGAL